MRLTRRLTRVSDSSAHRPPLPEKEEEAGPPWWSRSKRSNVPEGHVPVRVGEEMERFEVRTELLSRPAFLELLRRSAMEYGYEQRGVLRIPCSVPLFRRVLRSLSGVGGEDLAIEMVLGSVTKEIPEP
ncbi:auxin-responsive protein SAUR71-like [Typha latifolia]|uniref:auxin-responsive protein SAUR71-like n=1 Tax=Typha latifolia TaxID=4733 RepID=UPI003C2DADCB